jgi:hypothetical protein
MTAMQRIRTSLGDLFSEQGYASLAQHKEAVDALSWTTNQVLSELAGSADRPDQQGLGIKTDLQTACNNLLSLLLQYSSAHEDGDRYESGTGC